MGALCSRRQHFNHGYLAALTCEGELGKKYSVVRRLGSGVGGTAYLVRRHEIDLRLQSSLYVAKD